MSQVDVQWPSEDEDFDARVDAVNPQKTGVKAASVTSKQVTVQEPVDTDGETAPEASTDQPSDTSATTPETTTDQPETASSPSEGIADESEPAPPEQTAEAQPEHDDADREAAVPELAASEAEQPEQPEQPSTTEPAVSSPKVVSRKMPRNPREIMRLAFEAVLVVAVIGLGLWSWSLSSDRKDLQTQVNNLNANPQVAVEKQTQSLITSVGKLITLPTDETPTVAEVSNAAQAKQQSAFFANAQNGDKVLMYVKAGEAILYRPSTNKIILVAPLTFTNNTAKTTSSTTSTSKTK